MKRVVKKVAKKVNEFALKAAVQNANSTCLWLDHQPKVPAEAKSLRKF